MVYSQQTNIFNHQVGCGKASFCEGVELAGQDANTRRWSNVEVMMGRRWFNVSFLMGYLDFCIFVTPRDPG